MFPQLRWELVSNLNCVSSDKGPWQLLVINFVKNFLSLTLISSNQLAKYCHLFQTEKRKERKKKKLVCVTIAAPSCVITCNLPCGVESVCPTEQGLNLDSAHRIA